MDSIAPAVSWLEFIRPYVIGVSMMLACVVATMCLIVRPRTLGLLLLFSALVIGLISDFGYFALALHSQWKFDLFPKQILRILILVAQLLYIAGVFLWPIALLRLITERREKSPHHLTNR